MSERSDTDLLRGIRSDPEAVCALYDRYCESLLAALLRRGNDRELAFDVMQETFVRVLQGPQRARLGEDGSAWPWLWTVARNLLTDAQRRGRVDHRARERLRYSTVAYDADGLDALFDRLVAEDLAGRLEDALGELPAAQRDAVTARVISDVSYRELSRGTGVDERLLRQRVARGLRAVRLRLAGGKP